jgi:hypothetical protein
MKNMKKLISVFIVGLILMGCKQLMNGELQPVKLINAKENIYFTTCTGLVETWGTCHDKARQACKGDYAVLNRFETPTGGGRRELTFKCAK